MYCPRCSQQQVSDEVRFCARCGTQLDAVQALLAGGQGVTAEVETQGRVAPVCKRDVLLGATLMLACAVTVVLLTVSTAAGTPLQAVVIPLLLAWAAVVSVLLFGALAAREVMQVLSKGDRASEPAASSGLVTRVSAAARRQALPPAQGAPASGPGSWRINTAELAQPPTVTERTTDLLDKQ